VTVKKESWGRIRVRKKKENKIKSYTRRRKEEPEK